MNGIVFLTESPSSFGIEVAAWYDEYNGYTSRIIVPKDTSLLNQQAIRNCFTQSDNPDGVDIRELAKEFKTTLCSMSTHSSGEDTCEWF